MKLSERIWITRKARIHASERLDKYDYYSQFFITYFSITLIALGIWDLSDIKKDLSLYIVILSTIILCFSIFLTTRNFKVRSISLKTCYIKLHELFFKAVCLEKNKTNCSDKLITIEKEYINILSEFENHTHFDYLLVKFECRHDAGIKFSLIDLINLILIRLLRILLVIIMFSIPFIIILIILRIL